MEHLNDFAVGIQWGKTVLWLEFVNCGVVLQWGVKRESDEGGKGIGQAWPSEHSEVLQCLARVPSPRLAGSSRSVLVKQQVSSVVYSLLGNQLYLLVFPLLLSTRLSQLYAGQLLSTARWFYFDTLSQTVVQCMLLLWTRTSSPKLDAFDKFITFNPLTFFVTISFLPSKVKTTKRIFFRFSPHCTICTIFCLVGGRRWYYFVVIARDEIDVSMVIGRDDDLSMTMGDKQVFLGLWVAVMMSPNQGKWSR